MTLDSTGEVTSGITRPGCVHLLVDVEAESRDIRQYRGSYFRYN